jgi:hypothetical protein
MPARDTSTRAADLEKAERCMGEGGGPMSEGECRFNLHGFCETHQHPGFGQASGQYLPVHALCSVAADALRAEVARLVVANEHWHTRVEQMKQQVEALEARLAEVTELNAVHESEWEATTEILQALAIRFGAENFRDILSAIESLLATRDVEVEALREFLLSLDWKNVFGNRGVRLGGGRVEHAEKEWWERYDAALASGGREKEKP